MARPTTAASKLKTYATKRDFAKTPEPAPANKGRRGTADKPTFCVQKHLARALHYDFRLEHAGVLLSWAVPKGPSLDPSDKRMAVRTEDHPIAYGTFEGVIPSGYGAGIVMLWDQGTWTSEVADVDAALAKGELKFRTDGIKLKGSWVLVRTKRQFDAGREQWLLIKHRDAWSGDLQVADATPDSVKSFGDFATILAASKDGATFSKQKPTGTGQAAVLLRQVIEKAQKIDLVPKQVAASHAKPIGSHNAATRRSPAVTKKRRSRSEKTAEPAPRPKGRSPLPATDLQMGQNRPKLTNPDKALFPATGFAKKDLVDYYTRIAPLILPHLKGRAVTLKRYPDGVEGKFFFEKRCASHRPEWVKTARVAMGSRNESIDYCLIEDVATLQWAANLAAIELHVPLALADAADTPTSMVFDLDPGPPAALKECAVIALRLRDLLTHVGLKSFVKTSGSKGLHLMVPFNTPDITFDQTKSFARAIALMLERDDPKRVIASMARSAREGKVFVDWSQNDRAKTNVCVYSVRAREKPTISAPIDWDTLRKRKIPPVIADACKLQKDLFSPVLSIAQKLPEGLS